MRIRHSRAVLVDLRPNPRRRPHTRNPPLQLVEVVGRQKILDDDEAVRLELADVGGKFSLVVGERDQSAAQISRIFPTAACFIVPGEADWQGFMRRRAGERLRWPDQATLGRAAIFLPVDTTPQDVRDCLAEEITQALGPANDLYRLPDSIWNDDNFHGMATPFDMLILRALQHDPRHGLAIADRIQQISEDALRVEQGSLYPALYRLEARGWIKAEWGLSENNRKARFLSANGGGPQTTRGGAGALEPHCGRN